MKELSTSHFVTHLRELGIRVTAVGDKLEVRTREGRLPEAIQRELVARKPELLALLGGMVDRIEAIPKRAHAESVLSFAQQRLWFVDQLEGASAAYNVALELELAGPLDAGRLARSLAALVERHEVLRTTLHATDDLPRQHVAEDVRPTAVHEDLVALPADERARRVEEHARLERETPFDLARDPLLRYRLLRCGANEHVLLLTTHHIAADAWSMSILVRELGVLYERLDRGRGEPLLPPLPIRYADFAHWQRERVPARQLEHWRAQLRPPLPRSLPPLTGPRPARTDYRGALWAQPLPPGLTAALRRLAAAEGASLFMVLASALALVLARHCDEPEVVIGMPVAGRTRVEVEPLVGFFLNQLPLRIAIDEAQGMHALLGRVRQVTLDALANQEVPFERLVEEVGHDREASAHPLFEVMLNVINTPGLDPSLGDLGVVTRHRPTTTAKYPLTLHVRDEGDELVLSLGYQTAVLPGALVEAMLGQLVAVLEQAAAHPTRPLRELSLVTSSTRARVPDLRVPLTEPRHPPVTATIRERAAASPEHAALEQGPRAMTYAELDARADALARALVARGLRRGEVVGIEGPRSCGSIVALLGVLRAGGVVLPLDPSYPDERRAVMKRQARACLVVETWPPAGPSSTTDLPRLRLDPHTGTFDAPPADTAVLPTLAHDDAAYVFFTSGSTGVPKGVLGWHGALAHFCRWYREHLALAPADRVSQLAGPSFDGMLKDVLPTLAAGATLCLPEEHEAQDGAPLLEWLAQRSVTVACAVPSRVQAWLYDVPAGLSLPRLRWLNLAGEPLREALVRRFRETFGHHTRIMNFYGATELTVLNCFFEVPDPAPPGVQRVGWARPDTQVLVRSPATRRLCGVGEIGEVILRSPFCTRGYVNDPELTATRFEANPVRDDPRDRLYRTGDKGRLLPDGTVEVLGRIDDQVKIRGVRVELGEVKAWLGRHPDVVDCEVVPRKTDALDDLVAYVVLDSGRPWQPERLREHVASQLLPAMVPGAFVRLAALPLTPNGKVDRRALPEPDRTPVSAQREPATPTERALAELWAELLGVASVGATDGFFDIGGHSLLATRIISRVRAMFGVELAVRTFFLEPTIEKLAARIDLLQRARAAQAPLPHASEPDAADDAERDRGEL